MLFVEALTLLKYSFGDRVPSLYVNLHLFCNLLRQVFCDTVQPRVCTVYMQGLTSGTKQHERRSRLTGHKFFFFFKECQENRSVKSTLVALRQIKVFCNWLCQNLYFMASLKPKMSINNNYNNTITIMKPAD